MFSLIGQPVLVLREPVQDAKLTIIELTKAKTIIIFFIMIFWVKTLFCTRLQIYINDLRIPVKNELYFNLLLNITFQSFFS